MLSLMTLNQKKVYIKPKKLLLIKQLRKMNDITSLSKSIYTKIVSCEMVRYFN